MDDLAEKLRDMGATETMISSKTFKMVEQAIAESEIDGLEVAVKFLKEYIACFDRAKSNVTKVIREARDCDEQLNKAIDASSAKLAELKNILSDIDGSIVRNRRLVDSLNFYALMLQKTKEALGEEVLTEQVVAKLIDVSSLVMMRSIEMSVRV